MPSLEPLPDHREVRIAVGTSIRKPLDILRPHLQSIAWQELPPRHRLVPMYVPDFVTGQEDAFRYLMEWVNTRGGELIQGIPPTQPDFSDAPNLDSHQWTGTAMARVGQNKNRIIQTALNAKCDYLFLCDSDLILDRTTLLSLLACEKPITTAVYWTKWIKAETETRKVVAQPQVWLVNPYGLAGRGMDEVEFRQKLLRRELTRVWGFGACTLLNRRVLEAGINFDYLPDVPTTGMMQGEDRHFCVRAERAHIDAWADNWPDCFHIYHAADDIPRIPAMVTRLATPHPDRAQLGDLVSLRLRPLEPLQVGPGRFQQCSPVWERGRLGQIKLLPELEEAVYGMTRGEKQIVPVHFPISYPALQSWGPFAATYLRGRRRLMEVTLTDVKQNCHAPIVEDELYVGRNSGAWQDSLTLTPSQQNAVAESQGEPTEMGVVA